MGSCTILGRYYDIYRAIVDNPRIPIVQIAKVIGKTGRGRTRSTISRHLSNMYEKKVSLKPNLILRPSQNSVIHAYFCRKRMRKGIRSTFFKLHEDERINYVLFLSGQSDYFLTTREDNITFEEFDLDIMEHSLMYTPIFTTPYGWNNSMREALRSLSEFNFKKGLLSRKLTTNRKWSDMDWDIYTLMREDARMEFTKVGKKLDVFSSTVKDHFYKYVLPECIVSHYFFPRGYDFYLKSFLHIHSCYETSFIDALGKLSCTSYVYPLRDGFITSIFHDNTNDLMAVIEKLEETGIVESYLLYTPLNWFL